MSWIAVGIGAGAGLLKSELIDAPKAERQLQLAAATQRYSPWTHLQAQPVTPADPLGSAIQGGATGASIGQAMNNGAAANNLANAQAGLLNARSATMGQNAGLSPTQMGDLSSDGMSDPSVVDPSGQAPTLGNYSQRYQKPTPWTF